MIPRLKADLRISDLLAIWPRGNKFDDIRNFETDFAALAGQKQAVFFPYGRTAQLAILNALQLKEQGRTEIIMPSYSCVVVAHAIRQAGLIPVFIDVGADYNMRFDLLSNATNEKTGAVIATSIFGHPVDLEALETYQRSYPDVMIMQDCAHSFFARHEGGRDVQHGGLCAFYGLNISKIITSIFGGMVTTDNESFAEILREERQVLLSDSGFVYAVKKSIYLVAVLVAFNPLIYALVNRLERSGILNRFTKYYDENRIDWPDDGFTWPAGVQARIGRAQCRRYHKIVEHRRHIAELYHRQLADVPGLTLPPLSQGATVSHYVVQSDRAAEIEQALLAKGIQPGRLIDYEIPDMPVYQDAPYYGDHYSRALPARVVNLPVHRGVTERDAGVIVRQIKAVTGE